jgi:asparagine synthase (glutamine-hydrolysing)
MCGIAGIWTESDDRTGLRERIAAMTDRLVHRGPDMGGAWIDPLGGVALGHRRLAIIDLSPAGQQPMTSRCGRYVITYNGEIYNYRELRRELRDPDDRSTSDTQVLLNAIARWGLDGALDRLNGMYAFGLWDRQTRTLSLVTDRMGEKPLYYSAQGRDVVFASELKALRAHGGVASAIDDVAFAQYLTTGYVPAPRSIYRDVLKLEPGSVATFRNGASRGDVRRYWSPRIPGSTRLVPQEPHEAMNTLESLLADSVRLRLRSDVPLGVFFSGGIDSTAVLAMARKAHSGRLTAFTVGFEEAAYDEAPHARTIARHFDCEHVEGVLTSREALALIPDLPSIYDEPFGDASGVAACLLAAFARRHVTVALAGDGGDEMFGGYLRYQWAHQLWPLWGPFPAGLRRAASQAIRGSASAVSLVRAAHPGLARVVTRLGRISGSLAAPDTTGLNRQLTAQGDGAALLAHPATLRAWEPTLTAGTADEMLEQLMWLDTTDYLPNDLLVKVDRATMAVGLEARLPFLDHRLVEWASALDMRLRLRDGVGKWVLKQWLHRHVPAAMLDRPKQGFALPVAEWLRGPLRPWAEDLVTPSRLQHHPLLNPTAIRRQWNEHQARSRDWRHSLWPLLMFLAWDDRQRRDAVRDGGRAAAVRDMSPSVAC